MSARLHGDRGTAFVVAMVIMFTVTGGAALFLAQRVNQRVSDRSALQSIAFQAARAGAQQIDVQSVREVGEAVIDTDAATVAARAVVERLAGRYHLDARIVDQFATDSRRTWNIVVVVGGASAVDGSLRAVGVARVETGG